MRNADAKKTAAIIVLLVIIVSSLILTGWTPADAIGAVVHKVDGVWHDYTQEDVVSNGNKMPDGTVINPWDATAGLSGQARVQAVYDELIARTDPDSDLKRPSAALLAQLCYDAETRRSNKGNTLGIDILDRNNGAQDRPNEAQRDFRRDRDYARESFAKLKAIWESAEEVWLEELGSYDSAFYMIHNGILIDGELNPLIVARHSKNVGGHAICFLVRIKGTDEYVILRYRLECGFQPVDPDVPIPDGPAPVPDNPEPEPEPTPTPEPKDPSQDYMPRHHDDPDVGGGENHNSDTKITDEPTPEKDNLNIYKALAPPKSEPSGNGGGNGGGTPAGKEEASKGSQSGSEAADTQNGKTEGDETVTAGDGNNHGDMGQNVDDHPATVEPGAGDDNGAFAPAE